MSADEIRDVLTERLPEIERRLAWLLTRELEGSGRGPDSVRRIVRNVSERLAELREVLELPAAAEPTFDESVWS